MQLQNNKSITCGYTIIEILIVLVIMSMFLSFGYARYKDFASRQLVDVATRQISGDLRLAQSEALSGSKPATCTGVLLGYSVTFTGLASPPQYVVDALCANPVVGNPPIVVNVKSVDVDSDIVLSITSTLPTPPYVVVFRPFTLGTNIPSGGSIVINVQNTAGTSSKTITIGTTGEIR